jgi:hypothetical protein
MTEQELESRDERFRKGKQLWNAKMELEATIRNLKAMADGDQLELSGPGFRFHVPSRAVAATLIKQLEQEAATITAAFRDL